MDKFGRLVGVGVAAACAVAGLPGMALAAPTAATAPYTALSVDVGDAYGRPVKQSGVYDSGNATISATAHDDGRFSMGASNLPGGSYVSLWITPAGQTLTAGQTYQTNRGGDATHVGLDISSDSTGCNQSFGSLTVKEAARDPQTQVLTAFAAAYEFHCEMNGGAVTGEIRWNSGVDYVAVVSGPAPVDFGRVAIDGAVPSRTATFSVQGSVPTTFGAASLGGTSPASFGITGNTCSGRTIAPGGTCTVTLEPKAVRWGDYTANLLVADDSSYGKRVVPLKFTAYDTVIGMYYPLAPQRLMDTRSGLGRPAPGPVGTGQAVELQVTGRGGVPAGGVGSVVLNVTVTGPTAGGFLTLYPAGQGRPMASSINFAAGWLGSNNVTVKVAADGRVAIYNHSGSTHVVVDVVGFYASSDTVKSSLGWGGQYQVTKPTRLIDTRQDGGAIAAGGATGAYVDFGSASPRVKALVLNITAVAPARGGFLSAWSGDGPVPPSSTVNYSAGKVVPNLAIVQTGTCTDCGPAYAVPTFAVYTSQTANIVVDLVGVIDDGSLPDGLRFTPMSPTRIVDSRSGLGTSGALGANLTRKINAPATVLTDSTEVLAMNVTAVSPTSGTVLTVWAADAGLAKPTVSNLNPAAGQTVSNAVMGALGPLDAFNVHNLLGSTHLVADVVGRFYLYSGTASTTTAAGATAAGPQRLTVVGSGPLG
jgi:hypothetical protein